MVNGAAITLTFHDLTRLNHSISSHHLSVCGGMCMCVFVRACMHVCMPIRRAMLWSWLREVPTCPGTHPPLPLISLVPVPMTSRWDSQSYVFFLGWLMEATVKSVNESHDSILSTIERKSKIKSRDYSLVGKSEWNTDCVYSMSVCHMWWGGEFLNHMKSPVPSLLTLC